MPQYYPPPPPPPGYAFPFQYAGYVERFVAAFIDLILLAVIAIVVAVPLGILSAGLIVAGGPWQSYLGVLWGPVAGLTFLLWVGYFTYFESTSGQTIGKRALGLRVVTLTTGRPPDLGRSLLRNVLRIVDWLPAFYLLGFVVAAISDRRQRLGDLLAETLVVKG